MSDKTQHGPHPVPPTEEDAAKRGGSKQEPNTHLERRQDRNSDLTEKAQDTASRGHGAPKPDPANR